MFRLAGYVKQNINLTLGALTAQLENEPSNYTIFKGE
jgi:hypothetical protein